MVENEIENEPITHDEGPEIPAYVPTDLDRKILELFPSETVNKCLTETALLSSRAFPTFVSDWLIAKFAKNDELDNISLQRFLDNYLPDKRRAAEIKRDLIDNSSRVKILADFRVIPDIKSGDELLEIPVLDISGKEGVVDPTVLDSCPELLNGGTWGVGELIYQNDEKKKNGRVVLKEFTPFRPYKVNVDYYRKARGAFTDITEWMDFLLKAMGYNSLIFDNTSQKMWMLSRLLPFVEPRVNLIELAPKGTGKSHVFGRLSKYGWLISGGSVSRAQLFYDISKRKHGIISHFDYVALDEIQSINFGSKPDEVIGALKGYLESGEYRVSGVPGESEAGFVLLGNIPISKRGKPVSHNYFESLPGFMHESAFLDRFHGFIKGWEIPRITDGSTGRGYAINSEFFSEITHNLRKDTTPVGVVEAYLDVSPEADKRDARSVKRLATGFLKLLYPQVRAPSDISPEDFGTYCFSPAYEMRKVIREQLHRLDEEYSEEMPHMSVRK